MTDRRALQSKAFVIPAIQRDTVGDGRDLVSIDQDATKVVRLGIGKNYRCRGRIFVDATDEDAQVG